MSTRCGHSDGKLVMLDAAETLDYLRVPSGNRLEKLKGDRVGQQSIRINRWWRICPGLREVSYRGAGRSSTR